VKGGENMEITQEDIRKAWKDFEKMPGPQQQFKSKWTLCRNCFEDNHKNCIGGRCECNCGE